MLAMLTGLSGFLSSSSSRMDASSATTTSLQQGSISSTSVVRTNNNKAVSFKSQSPSEDKTIHLYSGLALPCETDHMYANYPSEGKRELADEVSHLKALVLFHLDLIQQQSECNAAKDKQLTALKLENEMVCFLVLCNVCQYSNFVPFSTVASETGANGEEGPTAERQSEVRFYRGGHTIRVGENCGASCQSSSDTSQQHY